MPAVMSTMAGECRSFVKGFEKTFKVMKNGTLHADLEHCKKAARLLRDHNFIISMVMGVRDRDVPVIKFKKMSWANPKSVNENKVKMMNAMTWAYPAYIQCCKVLGRDPVVNSQGVYEAAAAGPGPAVPAPAPAPALPAPAPAAPAPAPAAAPGPVVIDLTGLAD